jgi:ribosomal protein L40E
MFDSPSRPELGNAAQPLRVCQNDRCQAGNPASARFCRRCGHELLKRQLSRQAAMW